MPLDPSAVTLRAIAERGSNRAIQYSVPTAFDHHRGATAYWIISLSRMMTSPTI